MSDRWADPEEIIVVCSCHNSHGQHGHPERAASWREKKCIGPKSQQADLWINIWEETGKVGDEDSRFDVMHVWMVVQ